MVHTCVVWGCTNRADPGSRRQYFDIPKVVKHKGTATEQLSMERRNLNRDGFNPDPSKRHYKVCSDHFITEVLPGEFCTPSGMHHEVSMQAFIKPRTVDLRCITLKREDISNLDISPGTRKGIIQDRNYVHAVIRKTVDDMQLKSVRGIAYLNFVNQIAKLIPNLDKDNKDFLRMLKKQTTGFLHYKKKRCASPRKEVLSQRKKLYTFPSEYMEEDGPVEELLKIGNEVCLLFEGYPVGKGRVRCFPCTDHDFDVAEEERNQWVGIQVTLKKRMSVVDYLPWNRETRKWEDIGKGSKLSWKVEDIKKAEHYDEYLSEIARLKRKQPVRRRLIVEPQTEETERPEEPQTMLEIEERRPEMTDVEEEVTQVEGVQELEEAVGGQEFGEEPGNETGIGYHINDYVEVKLVGTKGKEQRFYALIIAMEPEIEVSFLKDTPRKNVKTWPRIPDVSIVDETEVIRKLKFPSLDARERLIFED